MALINLSSNAGALGDYATAIQSAKQSLTLSRRSGDRNLEAWALTYLGHALFETEQLDDSTAAYREAFDIRQKLSQMLLATEPCAGLARIALSRGRLLEAVEYTESILGFLMSGNNLDGTDQPLRVYLNCYLALHTNADPRADEILRIAYSMLNAHAASISDVAARRTFLENVSYNREIIDSWNRRGMS